jgi:hypothetical protein
MVKTQGNMVVKKDTTPERPPVIELICSSFTFLQIFKTQLWHVPNIRA